MSPITVVDEFGPDDPRLADFAALLERLRPEAPAEPLSPRARCLLARREGAPVARLSWEIAGDLTSAPGPTGILGHYEATDREAGVALLRHAQQFLARRGVDRIVGPMNSSTWARYRFALPREP